MSVETVNHWGETFLSFAWPMLWQSSLLIAIIFVLDFLLARKIRASVRHALWLVVLVKLLLPPTLALPTGATWWLWPAKSELAPAIKNVTVTYSTAPLTPIPESIPAVLPPARLNGEGWTLLTGGAVSGALLLWLGFNWLKVAAKTRRTTPNLLEGALEEARERAGWRGRVQLKLVEDAMSPAVFGLFRPVILLPQALAEKLSAEQLRTVLLHEVIHVRRGDVWVNCAQTLLQIAYWWHPLLWLANARIRRLREEAVDDAVMAALDKEAGVYAPMLLEVAKFAFRRPLASLGLVGILESRSALRQRIERLVDFRPPRKAGLTVLSLCVIFAFGAVAVPMGQAPVTANDSTAPKVENITTNLVAVVSTVSPNAPVAVVSAALTNGLETRTFKIDPNLFSLNLERMLHITNSPTASFVTTPPPNRAVNFLAKEFFEGLGVNLDPPKSLSVNDRIGLLYVNATPQDLDVIERAIGILTYAPSQIHIKARFMEMPSTIAGNMVSGTGILTAKEMKKMLALLKSQKGVRDLSDPEVTTLSGRRTEMMVGNTVQVVTNFAFVASAKPNVPAISPQMSEVEMGEMFDVVPHVLADGYTIYLTATASHTEFFGYADPKGFTGFTTNYGQGKIQLPVVLPAIQMRTGSTLANIWDGQTLVLFPNAKELVDCAPDEKTQERVENHIRKAEKKNGDTTLVVFATVTLIDPVGNRIHSNDEVPFAQSSTPPQPQAAVDSSPGNPGGHFPGQP